MTSHVSMLGPEATPALDGDKPHGRDPALTPMRLPTNLTAEDFTRAVAAATVSALRQHTGHNKAGAAHNAAEAHDDDEHGGHEGPSWSRLVSAAVLLSCTVLYAAIAGMFSNKAVTRAHC